MQFGFKKILQRTDLNKLPILFLTLSTWYCIISSHHLKTSLKLNSHEPPYFLQSPCTIQCLWTWKHTVAYSETNTLRATELHKSWLVLYTNIQMIIQEVILYFMQKNFRTFLYQILHYSLVTFATGETWANTRRVKKHHNLVILCRHFIVIELFLTVKFIQESLSLVAPYIVPWH